MRNPTPWHVEDRKDRDGRLMPYTVDANGQTLLGPPMSRGTQTRIVTAINEREGHIFTERAALAAVKGGE